ncbi:hypothetical protein BASA81_002208 [Batrachochytrium salamandrivorans]|nr:hypothetical protein BASA81_002208 [Batrachochytrium salamandrivorans]
MKFLLLALVLVLGVWGKKTSAEWNKFVRDGSEIEQQELKEVREMPGVPKFDPIIIGMDFVPGYSERDRELAGRRISTALRQASLHINMQRTGESTPNRWVLLTRHKDEAKQVFAFFKEFISEMDDIMRVKSEDLDMDLWNLPRFQKEMEEEKQKPKPKRKYGMPDEAERRYSKLSMEEKIALMQEEQEREAREL